MKCFVQSLILWFLINAIVAEDLPRFTRSRATVCVELKPTRGQQEPYYMCKGGDVPRTSDVSYRGQTQLGQQPIYSFRSQKFNDFKDLQRTNQQSSSAIAEPKPSQVWAYPRYAQQTLQTQPILQSAMLNEQTERAMEYYAQNAPYFAATEKPFQTLQTQYRQAPNSYTPQHFRYRYSQPSEKSAHPYAANYRSHIFGEPSQRINYRYGAAAENVGANNNEHFHNAHPAALDQLVSMDRSTYEPFAGAARSNAFQTELDANRRQLFADEDLLFGDVEALTNKYPTQQAPINLLVDVAPEDLRNLLNQPALPAEFMQDPVLRTFYSSLLEDKSAVQSLLLENEQELNENMPVTTEKAKTETKTECPTCESSSSRSYKSRDDDFENFSAERISSRGPYTNKDFNWPPVVIAMPCCGQQQQQQPSMPPTPPMPTAGYYNAMPMLGMFPNFMAPFNTAAMEINSQSRAAYNEESYVKTTTAATSGTEPENKMTEQTTKVVEAVTETNTNPIVTTKKEDQTDFEDNLSAETTTLTEPTLGAEAGTTELATAAVDTLKPKDDPPKTFQTMLNRAKTFKELAEAGEKLKEEEALNKEAKKGKRQNFKDANAALRTIAEVVAASNKRKYSTMIH